MQKISNQIVSFVKNILSPPRCSWCMILLSHDLFSDNLFSDNTVFCAECVQKIDPVVSSSLVVSGKTIKVFAVSAYKEPLRSLILAKSRSSISASRHLGQLMLERTAIKYAQIDYVIPIPLFWTRFAYRGYNQAYEMASVVAAGIGKSVVKGLKRAQYTRFQSLLTHAERAKNVAEVFSLVGDGSIYKNKHILLVDDLLTTGATVQSAARVLLKYKPASITVLVACRVV